MPVTSLRLVKRMAELQGSEFPPWLAEKLEAVGDDPAAVRAVGVAEATKLCQTLLDGGVPGLHFYTLNRSNATARDLRAAGAHVRLIGTSSPSPLDAIHRPRHRHWVPISVASLPMTLD